MSTTETLELVVECNRERAVSPDFESALRNLVIEAMGGACFRKGAKPISMPVFKSRVDDGVTVTLTYSVETVQVSLKGRQRVAREWLAEVEVIR